MPLINCFTAAFLSLGLSPAPDLYCQQLNIDSIEVNVPFSGSYFRENSFYQRANDKGYFALSGNSRIPEVVMLRFSGKETWVLLSTGRELRIDIDSSGKGQFFSFSGVAAAENNLLLSLKRESGQWDSADRWSKDSLLQVFFPQIRHELDSCIQIIDGKPLPPSLKSALRSEVKYDYANELFSLIQRWARRRNASGHPDVKSFNTLRWSELAYFGMPGEDELAMSQSAKVWMDNYLELKFSQRLDTFKSDPDVRHAKEMYGRAIGISLDNRDSLMKEIGQSYPILVLDRRNILPAYGEERRLADLIFRGANDDLGLGIKTLHDNLIHDFPGSKYIGLCEAKIAATEKLGLKNRANPNIHISEDGQSVNSITDLIRQYKGKVIYLDIWGTWCGPCIEEMRHVEAVRERFKNAELVYLFVDKDEDKDDIKWREFIYTHNLPGEHFRMNQAQIVKIWGALGEISPAYPHYCIFGEDGNLFVENACRPSDGEKLYSQIDAALNKNRLSKAAN